MLDEIYESRRIEDAEGRFIDPFPTATPRETADILVDLVRNKNLDRTLEVGMAYGLSSLALCQAHEDKGTGHHIAVDPAQATQWSGVGLLNVERAGLAHRLRMLEERSDVALPRLVAEGVRLDLVFIDGMHTFDYALVDFFFADQLVVPGGYIVLDDVWMPAVRKVASFVLRNRDYEPLKVDHPVPVKKRVRRLVRRLGTQNPIERNLFLKLVPHNVLVLRKRGDDDRAWDYHRAF